MSKREKNRLELNAPSQTLSPHADPGSKEVIGPVETIIFLFKSLEIVPTTDKSLTEWLCNDRSPNPNAATPLLFMLRLGLGLEPMLTLTVLDEERVSRQESVNAEHVRRANADLEPELELEVGIPNDAEEDEEEGVRA
ncbi:hypothetical protein APHAL10511_001477 [Amanita phalloides]|nr:hypothetical protein APHAL10511_001477 [Amanita phalloides]